MKAKFFLSSPIKIIDCLLANELLEKYFNPFKEFPILLPYAEGTKKCPQQEGKHEGTCPLREQRTGTAQRPSTRVRRETLLQGQAKPQTDRQSSQVKGVVRSYLYRYAGFMLLPVPCNKSLPRYYIHGREFVKLLFE